MKNKKNAIGSKGARARTYDVGNLAFAQAMHGKHNLTHDPRPKRQRTRAASKHAALREW
jgi:hypothetical protein